MWTGAGALDCEDETNGGFRESVAIKLSSTKTLDSKNRVSKQARIGLSISKVIHVRILFDLY